MRIGDLEYEPCGHTSHWTCIPPRPYRKDVIYDKNDLIRYNPNYITCPSIVHKLLIRFYCLIGLM